MTASFSANRSETVGSTDFGSETMLTIGTWTGGNRIYGLSYNQRTNTTNFKMVNGKAYVQWSDVHFNYRWKFFYPHLIIGHCNVKVTTSEGSVMDSLCSQVGFGLTGKYPASNSVIVNVTTQFTQAGKTHDIINTSNKVSGRLRMSAGVEIHPGIDWIHFPVGYSYQTYSLTVDGQNKGQLETGPYAGVSAGYKF
jgi:hypothetical protein